VVFQRSAANPEVAMEGGAGRSPLPHPGRAGTIACPRPDTTSWPPSFGYPAAATQNRHIWRTT